MVPITIIAMILTIIVAMNSLLAPATIVGSHVEYYTIMDSETRIGVVGGFVTTVDEIDVNEVAFTISSATLHFSFVGTDLTPNELASLRIWVSYRYRLSIVSNGAVIDEIDGTLLENDEFTGLDIQEDEITRTLQGEIIALPDPLNVGDYILAELMVAGTYQYGTPLQAGIWGGATTRIGYSATEITGVSEEEPNVNVATPQGYVYDEASPNPVLIGVIVTSNDGNETTTNSVGRFEIGVTEEPYTLTFTLQGYEAVVKEDITGSGWHSIYMDKTSDRNITDSDGDGYSDYEEQQAGTDPTDPNDYPTASTATLFIILIILIIALVLSILVLVGMGVEITSVGIIIAIWSIAIVICYILFKGLWVVI